MAKSILQDDKTHCFICEQIAGGDPLDCHHVFGAANRKLSEKYGLKVYIHHSKCHIFEESSVHKNAEIDNRLKQIAQRKAMEVYGWDKETFIKIFGRSYI